MLAIGLSNFINHLVYNLTKALQESERKKLMDQSLLRLRLAVSNNKKKQQRELTSMMITDTDNDQLNY